MTDVTPEAGNAEESRTCYSITGENYLEFDITGRVDNPFASDCTGQKSWKIDLWTTFISMYNIINLVY